jgi:hypothetical protein
MAPLSVTSPIMSKKPIVLMIWGSIFALGCASPNRVARNAPRVPYAELGQPSAAGHAKTMSKPPYIIEVKQGDEIPVSLALSSQLVDLEASTFRLTAKQDFWILILEKGAPKVSEDGVNFEQAHQNSFALGFNLGKDRAPGVDIRINYRDR